MQHHRVDQRLYTNRDETGIDLYLGSDIGLWALDQIAKEDIKHVLTLDHKIANYAQVKGLVTLMGDANEADFKPANTGLSVHYPRIVKPALIARYQQIYNLHPSYLPWGKGYYPVFWALWEDTPAGATLHQIVEAVDAGAVVEQIRVEKRPFDTGFSLFQRVRAAEKQLFKQYISAMIQGEKLSATPQSGKGTYHTKREFYQLKRPERWRSMDAEQIIRLIRCLSFPAYTGLELSLGEKRFSISAELIEED